jgi:hypothetical protein
VGPPTNPPQALATLLQYWKVNHPSGSVQHTTANVSVYQNAGMALLAVSRTGGSTGPVTVDFATADGTALAGIDYTATSGTLSWTDGDTSPKTLSIPLLDNPTAGPERTLSVQLRNPQYGTLGELTTATLTLNEAP